MPVPRSGLLSQDSDDEEAFSVFDGSPPEVQAVTALVDMLDGLGEEAFADDFDNL